MATPSLRKFRLLSSRLRLEPLEDRTVLAAGIGIYAPATDQFIVRNTPNAGQASANFRIPDAAGSFPVTGDWNGDGREDFGVFDRATATWSLKYGGYTGSADAGVFRFGAVNTYPVVGDWNGDGRDDIGTFNPATSEWRLRYGASPGAPDAGVFRFGQAGFPVAGDWNGDGRDGIGTFTSSTATWNLRQTATAGATDAGRFVFGPAGTYPVSGDWNGDRIDGIGTYRASTGQFALRQTANAGSANAGAFTFGRSGYLPVAGDFAGPAAPTNALTTITLKPLNLDLLGLEVRTSPITVTLGATGGEGKLLGNLLTTATNVVDLKGAGRALTQVLGSTVDLLNSVDLSVTGVGSGDLTNAPADALQVLELFVAPVKLDLLGAKVTTSPIRVTITAKSGDGLVLGNVVNELADLFNPPLPTTLDIDLLNTKLQELLTTLNEQIPGISPAESPSTPVTAGQILNVTVPALDLDLLGLNLETSPITVNASATTGNGLLLGNVLTSALDTLGATPENLATLNNNVNAILAKVVGVLNASALSLSQAAVDALPPALRSLASATLVAPAGSTTPILDLVIASPDGTSPPVAVDLLGLSITTSNIDAKLNAVTGEGKVLGNLLYNVANLANPGAPATLLALLNRIGAGNLATGVGQTTLTPTTAQSPQELLTLKVKPLDLDLLGLKVTTDQIDVTVSTLGGDGKLLGNILGGVGTLLNTKAIGDALNNVLATTVDLVNSVDLVVNGVGTGTFDAGSAQTIPVLDVFVAPVRLDVLGLVVTTSPIHLKVTATSGQGNVLGNIVVELANLFNPPLPERLDIDEVNRRLAALLSRINQQIPNIPPAASPPVTLGPDQFLEVTVPALNLDLLGLGVKTTPITVNAFAQPGDGQLLGNVLKTALNTLGATQQNLTGLSGNLNAILAKVVGVLNASNLILGGNAISALPSVLQTLALPTLISPTPGKTVDVLNLIVASENAGAPPVEANLLGLRVTTSDITARLTATTGDTKVLGNLVYNVANLLNPGNSATLLLLLTQLGKLT